MLQGNHQNCPLPILSFRYVVKYQKILDPYFFISVSQDLEVETPLKISIFNEYL